MPTDHCLRCSLPSTDFSFYYVADPTFQPLTVYVSQGPRGRLNSIFITRPVPFFNRSQRRRPRDSNLQFRGQKYIDLDSKEETAAGHLDGGAGSMHQINIKGVCTLQISTRTWLITIDGKIVVLDELTSCVPHCYLSLIETNPKYCCLVSRLYDDKRGIQQKERSVLVASWVCLLQCMWGYQALPS